MYARQSRSILPLKGGGGGAQSVEPATGEEVLGSIPVVAARSLLVGSAETEVMVSPLCLMCGSL